MLRRVIVVRIIDLLIDDALEARILGGVDRETARIEQVGCFILRIAESILQLLNRLCRIEGQVRGLQEMQKSDAYCPDNLIQVSAVGAAMNSFSKELLASHIRTCVADGIRQGDDEVIDELVTTLQKLMK